MDDQEFGVRMNKIVQALKGAGYDPYTQLYGYICTGDATYITRQGNARDEISKLDQQMIRKFILELNGSE